MFVDVGQYGGEQLRAGRFEVPEGAGDEIGCAVRVFGEYRDHVDVGEESQALLGSKPGQHALGGQGVAVAAPKPVDSSCGGPDRDAGMWCVVEHLVDSVGVEGCRVADPYLAGGRAGDRDQGLWASQCAAERACGVVEVVLVVVGIVIPDDGGGVGSV